MILHRRLQEFGTRVWDSSYTLYEVPLGPGAELALALRTTSRVPDLRQLQLRHIELHSWFRGFYEVVLLSCGVTVQLLQMLVYVFLRGGGFAAAHLPQQILGELKGVSDESSTFACSLSPPPVPLSPVENSDRLL